jgi:hypothetical protein
MKRAVIVGAGGMIGGYALRHLPEDPAGGGVTSIERRSSESLFLFNLRGSRGAGEQKTPNGDGPDQR